MKLYLNDPKSSDGGYEQCERAGFCRLLGRSGKAWPDINLQVFFHHDLAGKFPEDGENGHFVAFFF